MICRYLLIYLIVTVIGLWNGSPNPLATSGFAEESVYLKNGQFQKGKLISQTDTALTFEYVKSGATDAVQVPIPWDSIDHIEFSRSTQLLEALAKPDAVDLHALAQLWIMAAPWISRPNSPAAEIGLVYASRLAMSDGEETVAEALDLFGTIAKSAWQPEKQAAGLRGRLTTLLKAGREREAVREAEAIAQARENPALLLESKLILAANAFEKLKMLEHDHPRWELDNEVRPERYLYFNTAIDHSLYAYLFFGSEEEAAATGLLHAAEVYRFAGDQGKAKLCAGDILKLYPNSAVAPKAAAFLGETPSKSN